jgi:hypothetical protein
MRQQGNGPMAAACAWMLGLSNILGIFPSIIGLFIAGLVRGASTDWGRHVPRDNIIPGLRRGDQHRRSALRKMPGCEINIGVNL